MIHNNPLMEYSPNLNIRHECLSSKAPNYENSVGDRCPICYLDHAFSRAIMAVLVKFSQEQCNYERQRKADHLITYL